MTQRPNDETRPGPARERREDALRHPVQSAEHGIEHLKEIVEAGESVATPAILTATWIAIVLPLVAIVVGLAFGVAYLVTGSAGTHYPAASAGHAAFDGTLDEQQIREVAAFVSGVSAGGPSISGLPPSGRHVA